MNGITFEVRGIPGPQGSKDQFGRESSKKVKPWREAVRWSAVDAIGTQPPYPGAVEVLITFSVPRPKAHYRTGRHAGELRPDAPAYCDRRPDLDKLTRSTLDALTAAGVYEDDARVAHLDVWDMYADPQPVGATITVRPL